MGKEIYISKEKVPSVLSIARHLQDINFRGKLEQSISEFLPASNSEQNKGIPEQAMYELGEDVFGIDPEYIQRSMQLHSDSEKEIMTALNNLKAFPSESLADRWHDEFSIQHSKLIFDFLNQISPEDVRFLHPNVYSLNNYPIIFKRKKKLGKRVIGKVGNRKKEIKGSKIAVEVNLEAYTPKFLAICSGPLRDLTLQFPKVSSCNVVYDPESIMEYPVEDF